MGLWDLWSDCHFVGLYGSLLVALLEDRFPRLMAIRIRSRGDAEYTWMAADRFLRTFLARW